MWSIKRWPGRPPKARHTTPMISLDRLACHAYGAHAGMSPRIATLATELQHENHRNALDGKVLQKTRVLAADPAQTATCPAGAPKLRQNRFKCSKRLHSTI